MKISNWKPKLFFALLFLVVVFSAWIITEQRKIDPVVKGYSLTRDASSDGAGMGDLAITDKKESVWKKIAQYVRMIPGVSLVWNSSDGVQVASVVKEYYITRDTTDIVLPKVPSDAEKEIRSRIVQYVRAISGVDLDTCYEGESPNTCYDINGNKRRDTKSLEIHIGKTSRWNNYSSDFSKINNAGILIRFVDDTEAVRRYIHIGGKSEEGILNAGYYFVERYLGVRWYISGDDGTYIPKSDIVKVPAIEKTENPSFEDRRMSGISDTNWAKRNQLNEGIIRFGHNLFSLVDPNYADSNSGIYNVDFFPEIKGGKIIPKIETKSGGIKAFVQPYSWQPVFTNQNLRDAMAQRIVDLYSTAPSISLGLNDSGFFDEKYDIAKYYSAPPSPTSAGYDAAYTAWWAGLKEKYHNTNGYLHLSDLVFDAFNDIVSQVTSNKGFENRIFGALAYHWTEDAPWTKPWNLDSNKVLHSQIMPYVTYDRTMWRDPVLKEQSKNLIRAWIPKASQIGIYDYLYGNLYAIPRFTPHLLAESLRFHSELKKNDGSVFVKGFHGEAYPNWGLDGIKLFVVSKFLWNTSEWNFKYYSNSGEMVDAIMNEFYQNFFQEAKGPMKEYFDELENAWMNMTPEQEALFKQAAQNRTYLSWAVASVDGSLNQLSLFPPERIAYLKSRLDAAASMAQSDLAKRRIAFFRTSFDNLALCSEVYHKRKALEDIKNFNDQAKREAAISAFENFISTKERRKLHTRAKMSGNNNIIDALGDAYIMEPYDKAIGPLLAAIVQERDSASIIRLNNVMTNELKAIDAIEAEYKQAGITNYTTDLNNARDQLKNLNTQVKNLIESSVSENNMINGGFEDGSNLDANSAWNEWRRSTNPGSIIEVSGDNPFGGKQMVRFQKGTGAASVYQNLPALVGQTYQLGGFMRVKSPNNISGTRYAILVMFYKSDGTKAISDKIIEYPSGLNNIWSYFSLRFNAPSGTSFIRIHASAYGQRADGSDIADFDSLAFFPIVNAAYPSSIKEVPFSSKDKEPFSANILSNPTFETGVLTPWTIWRRSTNPNSVVEVSTESPFSGTYSVKMRGSIGNTVIMHWVSISPEKQYLLSGMFKVQTASKTAQGKYGILIKYYSRKDDGTLAVMSTGKYFYLRGYSIGSWVKLSQTITTPSGAVMIVIEPFAMYQDSGGLEVLYLDDVFLSPL